jgi:hypothetical protein
MIKTDCLNMSGIYLKDFCCYIIHVTNKWFFARKPSITRHKILYKFIGDYDFVTGDLVNISGECEDFDPLIIGSGGVYGIPPEDEKNWSVATVRYEHKPSHVSNQALWQIGSKWKCGDRVIVITEVKHDNHLDSKVMYELEKGKRRTSISLKRLITNYQPIS